MWKRRLLDKMKWSNIVQKPTVTKCCSVAKKNYIIFGETSKIRRSCCCSVRVFNTRHFLCLIQRLLLKPKPIGRVCTYAIYIHTTKVYATTTSTPRVVPTYLAIEARISEDVSPAPEIC